MKDTVKAKSFTRFSKNFFPNGDMTLFFTIFIQKGEQVSRIKHSICAEEAPTKQIFKKDAEDPLNMDESRASEVQEAMRKLYSERVQTDFTLKAGGRSFAVHRSILCVRSPVFLAMFSTDMKERGDIAVDVTDIDEGTMDDLLKFMYYGGLEISDFESGLKLYAAADKYEVRSLKEECGRYLQLHLSQSNVCDVLRQADSRGDQLLKEMAMRFAANNWRVVVRSPQFKQMMVEDVELASSVMDEISQNST